MNGASDIQQYVEPIDRAKSFCFLLELESNHLYASLLEQAVFQLYPQWPMVFTDTESCLIAGNRGEYSDVVIGYGGERV